MAKTTNAENTKVDIAAIKRAIRELESPKAKRDRERAALFDAVYPDVRDQLEAGVSKSAIIKRLADYDVSISNLMFDEMLAAAAKRRGELVPVPVAGKEFDMPAQDVPADKSTDASQANVIKQESA